MLTQIYGFTCMNDMEAMAGLGIDHVGIVLDEGYGTWDGVDEHTARAVAGAAPKGMRVVALSHHTALPAILATVETVGAGIVHLVRACEGMTPDELAALRMARPGLELMVTIPVRDEGAIALARRYAPASDYLLLDTAHPETGHVGATGHTHDWSVSRRLVEAVETPAILAGGLGPGNVRDAIAAVQPAGVDSETRTSRDDDRRRKDVAKVREFVAAARR